MRFNAELNILSLVQNRKERACAQTKDSGSGFRRGNEHLPDHDYVFEGIIRRVASDIRFSARQIYAPNDEYVWGGDFVNVISAIKILQSVIAHAVAGHNRTPSRFLTGSRSSSHNPTCLYPLLVFL